MRIFERYNPLKVAKYVKTLFRGRLYIRGIGAFEFDYGKILLPKTQDKQHLLVMSEVNRQVMWLQADMG
ncbi:hypothetical protein CS369_15125 [Candidatus Symbiopectobacterium sp. 'North America']|uniref:DUF1107 domain-containing protein n=1 Tax=Candidatus Symbiopectobacterium sp. 'North America' TaxID=2794574 RepID=UPI0018C91FD8|nr:DUF1107 domain-containing protein [Candidatus Symbiopectobacterium sp. 'North America']MBG6245769.1 hypothetical protein [Candidatus Symbiopectobacterium sp. 'North America']